MSNIVTVEHKVKFTELHFDFTKHELHLIRDKRLIATLGIPIPAPGQILRIENIEGFMTFVTAAN